MKLRKKQELALQREKELLKNPKIFFEELKKRESLDIDDECSIDSYLATIGLDDEGGEEE